MVLEGKANGASRLRISTHREGGLVVDSENGGRQALAAALGLRSIPQTPGWVGNSALNACYD